VSGQVAALYGVSARTLHVIFMRALGQRDDVSKAGVDSSLTRYPRTVIEMTAFEYQII
jgi:hypothetical protein